ncbi:Atxe2 family lasso peptide isopeptidase [Sphingomonas sp. MG17]|uniref:Atxe2 family lasso peptide isopeptidase n=1 Tax=Sphingomonas tagetis TaxID=2949092 RepID=A0A9X2HI76_9SPHN|nr:Atxe2 family lasso peptide isopeptidase [Sphingomonas tagetis]MCP3731318.1 Atxe2 family lasso peptide isopeptidase [Sphingomonas tagetis]
MVALPARAACDGDDAPVSEVRANAGRGVDPLDLARLRDIGPTADLFLNDSPIGVSPDGNHIAFQVRRADPASNSFCHELLVVDLRSPAKPVTIDRGGELIRAYFQRGALANYPSGEPQLIRPSWSPDGRSVAFLKRLAATNQLWIASADGSGSRRLTNASADVEAFEWSADGTAIVFHTRPDRAAALAELETEGRSGFVYDERWSPIARNRPSHREPAEMRVEKVTLGGQVLVPTASERDAFARAGTAPDGAIWAAVTPNAVAWVAPKDSNRAFADGTLHVRNSTGATIRCDAQSCQGQIAGLWWHPDGKQLWFQRRTGWGSSQTALYRWTPGEGEPQHILTTRDLLLGCRSAGHQLVCALEQSSRPRRIVSIDPANGAIGEIFDPNPAFRQLHLGSVERLEWRNNRGIEIYGDLVMPPARKPGERVPLILVQYRTRGFLRGGTGNEYPLFALAAQGFAVLSIERPGYVSELTPTSDFAERARLNYGDWADRKSVMSAFASGIDRLDRRGLIDPKRVGITGFSDGSVSAQYALLNSSLFAAAALSSCCEEPKTHMPLLGPRGAARLRSYTYPRYTDSAADFWGPFSIAANATRFRTPLLVQASDDEYLGSLETFTSLRETGAPMELIVFPDEHHSKWQPAHRLAMYRRNIAWFSFWLKGDAGPFARPGETARWESLLKDSLVRSP